jgi:hypothetical protein
MPAPPRSGHRWQPSARDAPEACDPPIFFLWRPQASGASCSPLMPVTAMPCAEGLVWVDAIHLTPPTVSPRDLIAGSRAMRHGLSGPPWIPRSSRGMTDGGVKHYPYPSGLTGGSTLGAVCLSVSGGGTAGAACPVLNCQCEWTPDQVRGGGEETRNEQSYLSPKGGLAQREQRTR